METISTFIDGGGSVLVAASSDIGRSDLSSGASPISPGSLESFTDGSCQIVLQWVVLARK